MNGTRQTILHRERKEGSMIKLGTPVADIISGFQGIAVSRLEHMTGCTQYGVAPKVSKDGKFEDTMYIDETRLKEVGKPIELRQPIKDPKFPDEVQKPGGPVVRRLRTTS
jgi:hypothetical protein